ncbi:CARDB domain-containing protein [Halosolutus amylolyticus]|uniref:CARDB domain-containing protein n=1 Tax=Halosolutus amylolyticus TaxID=2932267 RepID=A0ABD5PSP8_9EURY|nr:CARDB domain-containing protein [Halosolutus amylolyticus]
MRRRRFLAGWGALPATITGGVSAIRNRVRDRAYGALVAVEDVELRIAETNAPVEGGSLLEVALEVANTGDRSVRPDIESYFDGDRYVTVRTTVEPGETKTLDLFSYRTAPVESDGTITVRFETESDAVEERVDVLAIEALDPAQTAPDPEFAVQPGTTVHFEVESDLLGEYGGRTRWFVDGEFAGQSMGPWDAAYYGHRGADHWQTTFESPGTREVAAAVVGEDDVRRASWTTTVTDDGIGAPVIEETDPADESIEFVRGESIDLSLDVAFPDGELDRVVWWLGHADVILGESDVSGSEDTASLELERPCYGCPIVTWVLGTDGTRTSERPWMIDEIVDDPDPDFDLTILETNDPVDTGETLDVTAELENRGATELTREIDLIVGHDPELVDSESVTVDGGETATVDLEFETALVRRTQTFPARVETEDASDEVTVEVIGTADIGLGVEILETNSPVETGDPLDVVVEVTNEHDSTLGREVQLVVGHDPDVVDAELVTLPPGESRVLTMGYETAIVERSQRFPARVESQADADERSVFVYVDEPPLLVSILDTNDPVATGDVLEVTAAVENPGETTVADRIEFIVGHDPDLVDVTDVELAGGERETIDLGFETAIVPRTQEFPVYVESDGDRAQRTVTVIGTEDDEVAIGFPDCTRAEAVGTFEAGDDLTVETLFVDTAGVGNDHPGLTIGDQIDPFSGTIRFEVGEENRIVDASGSEAVVELADDGFGTTIGSVIYNWFREDETREPNPHDCVDERRPEQPTIAVDDVSGGRDSHDVTFAYENPNDLELHGGAFVAGTTDEEPPALEPGTHSFTVEWTPESDDERLVWEVDLEHYLYDETLRAETDRASEYAPRPAAELAVSDQEGDGETLLVDGVTANVEFFLETQYVGETSESEDFDAETTIEAHELELDPVLEDDATVTVRVRDAETDDKLAAETIEYTLDLEAAEVQITGLDAPDAIVAGETLEATAELENVGEETATQEIALDVGAQQAVAAESIEVPGGESGTVTLSHETDPDDAGEVQVTVRSEDDEASVDVLLEEPDEPASFAVPSVDVPAQVEAGETLPITATIENEGDESGDATVELDVGAQQGVDSRSISSLAGGESESVSFTYPTADADVGDLTITVRTADDSDSVTVTVTGSEPDEPEPEPPEEPEPEPPDEPEPEPPDEPEPEPPADPPAEPPEEPPEDTPGEPPEEPPDDTPAEPPEEPPEQGAGDE